MGSDLSFKVGQKTFSRRISHSVWDTLKTLRAIAPKEVSILLDVPDAEDTVVEKVADLRSAVDVLTQVLRERKELLPATYEAAKSEHPMPFNAGVFSTGATGGIRLIGDDTHVYVLHTGFDKCLLERMVIRADGTGLVVERRDIRGETELLTQNWGRISIREVRARTDATRLLGGLRKFLKTLDSEEVEKSYG
jgi:hypothetical protein